MVDRLAFLLSRALGPLNNFVTLLVVGWIFGKAGVADYTYGLAAASPAYFLVNFALPAYLAVAPSHRLRGGDLLWTRLITAYASCGVATLALVFGGPRGAIAGVLWFLKAGEVLFDPVTVLVAMDVEGGARGMRLLKLEALRLVLGQATLWTAAVGMRGSLLQALGAVGAMGVLAGTLILTRAPRWEAYRTTWPELRARMGEILRICTPMAMSGILLATLIGLPRLLLDPLLGQDQRTLMGLAQVAGSVLSLVFNALWLYELPRLKEACASMRFGRILRHNLILMMAFATISALAAGAILVVPRYLPLPGGLVRDRAGTIALLTFLMALPHCLSLYRDVLKLVDRAWLEVRILVVALLVGLAAGYVGSRWWHMDWVNVVGMMVLLMTSVQVVSSLVALKWALPEIPRAEGNS